MKRGNYIAGISIFFSLIATIAYAGEPEQTPLFLRQPVTPIVMLNMSRDHQLYFKLYNDYSDISSDKNGQYEGGPDGKIDHYDTQYNPDYSYYGYFDSDKCYIYSNGIFVPSSTWNAAEKKFEPSPSDANGCNGTNDWSGNLLNWASMTRIDAVRKMLYGGYRYQESTGNSTTYGTTILERAYLPNDTHAFAKHYLPSSNREAHLKKVVPDTFATNSNGVTFCNTTDPSIRTGTLGSNAAYISQNVNEPPLLKVVRGDYRLWGNSERLQCVWKDDLTTDNGASGGWGQNGNTGSNLVFPNASSDSPQKSSGGSFNVRVSVCVKDKIADPGLDNENCKQYSRNNVRPTGFLNLYGENNAIHFGLMTGSYSNSKSGGVLRKNVGTFTNEIDLVKVANNDYTPTGRFSNLVTSASGPSIIGTLNRLRIFGYNHRNALYSRDSSPNWSSPFTRESYLDNCGWFGSSTANQPRRSAYFDDLNADGKPTCSNWGNPLAEIYLESLRYLRGDVSPNPVFHVSDSSYISGLQIATWTDPIIEEGETTGDPNFCAPLSVFQFNAATVSYDADQLGGVTDIGLASEAALNTKINEIGAAEGINNAKWFVGQSGTDNNQLCTLKDVLNFSEVKGICAVAPRLEGSYKIAGLAYHAYTSGIKPSRKKVRTFGVSLAPPMPEISITSKNNKTFKLMPACRNLSTYTSSNANDRLDANCAIVDYKFVEQNTDKVINGITYDFQGKVLVSWEDSEQGGDFDQDMWGIIEYRVRGDDLTVITDIKAEATVDTMGFGYVLGGTNKDGFHAHSGMYGFNYRYKDPVTGVETVECNNCVDHSPNDSAASSVGEVSSASRHGAPYTITGIADGVLEDPLYYAAKWGNFDKKTFTNADDSLNMAGIASSDPTASSYLYATEPKSAAKKISEIFKEISRGVGSASNVAANSTSQNGETRVYQARYDSQDWTGQMVSYQFNSSGMVDYESGALWNTDDTMDGSSFVTNRKVYTYDGYASPSLVEVSSNPNQFGQTSTLATTDPLYWLKASLKLTNDSDYALAAKRLEWLRGSDADENNAVVNGLRVRTIKVDNVDKRRILGDIINSDPGYAGAQSMHYNQLPAAEAYGASSYDAYVNDPDVTTDKADRKKMVFVGANDGMLHAFDAADGTEVFAYIPRGVYSKLEQLTRPIYNHLYTVDGPVYVSDYFRTSDNTWRTVVTGSLGAGGKGVYALDVTDVLSGTTTQPTVIFDYSADDSLTPTELRAALGYVEGRILVLPTLAENWVALVPNGTNSANRTSAMIAIDVNNPASFKILDTQVAIDLTADNGLSPAAYLPNVDMLLSYGYAGDVAGNLWKFDFTASSMDEWKIYYSEGGNPAPMINVMDPSGAAQPIMSVPTLGKNSLKQVNGHDSIMVYFGTGKYSEVADVSSTQVQSIYAIADPEGTETGNIKITATGSTKRTDLLHQKTMTLNVNTGRRDLTGDDTTSTIWSTKQGWFIDLTTGTAQGERVVSKPLLLFDRIIMNTFIPSTQQCDFGGDGWIMELVGVGDIFVDHNVLGDTIRNARLPRPILSDLMALSRGNTIAIIGSNIGGDPEGGEDESITVLEGDAGRISGGRMSWRQIK